MSQVPFPVQWYPWSWKVWVADTLDERRRGVVLRRGGLLAPTTSSTTRSAPLPTSPNSAPSTAPSMKKSPARTAGTSSSTSPAGSITVSTTPARAPLHRRPGRPAGDPRPASGREPAALQGRGRSRAARQEGEGRRGEEEGGSRQEEADRSRRRAAESLLTGGDGSNVDVGSVKGHAHVVRPALVSPSRPRHAPRTPSTRQPRTPAGAPTSASSRGHGPYRRRPRPPRNRDRQCCFSCS